MEVFTRLPRRVKFWGADVVFQELLAAARINLANRLSESRKRHSYCSLQGSAWRLRLIAVARAPEKNSQG